MDTLTNYSNGRVIWSGISLLDRKTPIVAIVTGLIRPSANIKTGPMLQTWILPRDSNPHSDVTNGDTFNVCGDCPLSKLVGKNGETIRPKRCFVRTEQAPSQIWKSFHAGNYPECDSLPELGCHRAVRLGAYGEPTAVPLAVWRDLVSRSQLWTGYTHQWRQGRFWRFKRYVMASCETQADHEQASSKGWRTFQTSQEASEDQIMCRNYSEGITCLQCGLCDGSRTNSDNRKSVVIPPHGGRQVMSAWNTVS